MSRAHQPRIRVYTFRAEIQTEAVSRAAALDRLSALTRHRRVRLTRLTSWTARPGTAAPPMTSRAVRRGVSPLRPETR